MPTPLEKRIQSQRRSKGGVIVPLLNELLKRPIGIDNEEDAQFLYGLAIKQVERERIRREEDGVFSPSSLATCLRRVYLSKNWKKLKLERVELPAIEPHYYFLTGDFLHLKWQLAFHKLSQRFPKDFILIDVEVHVKSKRGDHGGTIDVIGFLPKLREFVIVDLKGLNVRSFKNIDTGQIPHDYRIQVADYGMLWNAQRSLSHDMQDVLAILGVTEFPKIRRGFILAENKGGPDPSHPAALTEHEIVIKENITDVRARLEILREHEEKGEIPPVECTSTRLIQFTGCPFAEICRKEVREVERERAKDRDTKQYRLARPKRSNRPRRS